MLLYNKAVNNDSIQPNPITPQGPFDYSSGQLSAPSQPQVSAPKEEVRWMASEFISHEKSSSWYVTLALITVVFCGLVYLFTRQYVSIGVIVVLAIAFGVYANIKPKTLEFLVDSSGVTVDKKHFNYEAFKNIEIIEGGVVPSVNLIPVKRFAVPVTLYFLPQQKEQILEILGEFLPSETKRLEAIDRLVARLRF